MKRPSNLIGIVVLVSVLAVCVLTAFFSSYVQIDYGTVGMVTRFGRITGRIMSPGLNWKLPFVDRVVIYHTQEIVYVTADPGDEVEAAGKYIDYPTDTTTSDGQQIQVKYSVRFRIDPNRITQIANEIGDEEQLVEKVVKFHSRILARNIPKGYEALDLYTGNIQRVQEEFETQLRPLLEKKGVILEAFGLRKIDFRDDYVQAIEQKQIEAENVITEKNRAEQAKWKAQSMIEEAKGQAEATIENARGEAERIRLLAAAEAESIKLKGEALKQYPEVIQLEFVESLSDPNSNMTWGIMPPNSFLPFLNINPEQTVR